MAISRIIDVLYHLMFSTNTSLQFRGEVDPGSEDFWNRLTYKKVKKEHKLVALEIEEERVIYKKDQANAILEKLFRAGECVCV